MSDHRTIVADPPWPIKWTGGKPYPGRKTGTRPDYDPPDRKPLPYSTMTVDEIAALPVDRLGAEDCHLFLWTLDRFVIDGSAASVCRAWGFDPLPQLLVWKKRNAGLGRVIRPAHELIVVGRRGEARLNQLSLSSVFDWGQVYANGAKVHSAKPDASLDDIERLSSGPYLELFARRSRLGWDYWGAESLTTIEMPAA